MSAVFIQQNQIHPFISRAFTKTIDEFSALENCVGSICINLHKTWIIVRNDQNKLNSDWTEFSIIHYQRAIYRWNTSVLSVFFILNGAWSHPWSCGLRFSIRDCFPHVRNHCRNILIKICQKNSSFWNNSLLSDW